MLRPDSPEALATTVREANRLHVPLLRPAPEDGTPALSFDHLRGEIRHDVADGVVSCLAGTSLAELNEALARDNRTLPYAPVWPSAVESLAELILLGLPHAAEARVGSWRDWILGATLVTAEGERVRSGSRVVKSVAGYDAHKLLVGSRGALVLPAVLTFRTFHRSTLSFPPEGGNLGDKVLSVGRVRPSDLDNVLTQLGSDTLYVDREGATIWSARAASEAPDSPYAWWIDPYRPSLPASSLELQRRAKAVLDPTGKLAPGAFANL